MLTLVSYLVDATYRVYVQGHAFHLGGEHHDEVRELLRVGVAVEHKESRVVVGVVKRRCILYPVMSENR